MTIKTPIDIGDLVRWTCQDHCADLIVGSAAGLYEGEALVDGLGSFFGTGGFHRQNTVTVNCARQGGNPPQAGIFHWQIGVMSDLNRSGERP